MLCIYTFRKMNVHVHEHWCLAKLFQLISLLPAHPAYKLALLSRKERGEISRYKQVVLEWEVVVFSKAFDPALTRSLWQVQFTAASPHNSSLCRDAEDDLITAALRSLSEEMKRKHSGNIVIHHFWCENTWWLHLIWFSLKISKTKWNGADQTGRRSHLIALHAHTPLPALNCPVPL